MKTFVIVLVFVFTSVVETNTCCVDPPVEVNCAALLGIPTNSWFYAKPNPLWRNLTECVWRKMGFQKENGDIDYELIKREDYSLLLIPRICDVQSTYIKLLFKAVDSCRSKLSTEVIVEAENVRKCIENHVKWNQRTKASKQQLPPRKIMYTYNPSSTSSLSSSSSSSSTSSSSSSTSSPTSSSFSSTSSHFQSLTERTPSLIFTSGCSGPLLSMLCLLLSYCHIILVTSL